MVTIYKPGNINFKLIKYKKPFNIYNDTYIIDIKYLTDTIEPLIIQTPKVYLPFGITTYGTKKYIDIAFNDNIDPIYADFNNFTHKINKLLHKYKNKYPALFENKNYVKTIKPKNGIYQERLTLTYNENINIYNLNKDKINNKQITPKIYGKFIIHYSHIWTNATHWGYTPIILQIIIDPKIIITDLIFIEDDEPTIKDNPKYTKFFKMLAMGIPKPAIKQKMILESLDPTIIDMDPNKSITIPPNPITRNKNNIMSQIKMGFNLKTTKLNNDKKPILSYTGTRQNVPSLDDIHNAKNKLKKTNILNS